MGPIFEALNYLNRPPREADVFETHSLVWHEDINIILYISLCGLLTVITVS